jgi:hypothetical protein
MPQQKLARQKFDTCLTSIGPSSMPNSRKWLKMFVPVNCSAMMNFTGTSPIFALSRPFIINGIGEFANRPDLLERSISLKLNAMPEGSRRTEKEIWAEFRECHAGWLGSLFDLVSCALRNIDSVLAPTNLRMADSAQWLVAAEPGTGFERGTFLRALIASQNEIMAERAANDPLAEALRQIAPFDGTVGKLFDDLSNRLERFERLPTKTAAHLSTALARMRPALVKIGIHVEFGNRTRKGRMISIRIDEEEAVSGVRGPIVPYDI